MERAKTVLIYAFLGLNLFLGYHLVRLEAFNLPRPAVSVEELQQAEAQLAGSNYFVATAIDRDVCTSSFITVSAAPDWPARVLERAAGPGAVFTDREGTLYYRGEEAEVFAYPGGLIRLVYEPGVPLVESDGPPEDRTLQLQVEHFLQQRGLMSEESQIDYVDRSKTPRIVVRYYQDFDGMPLFAGYTNVLLEGGCVTAVELYRLEPLEWSLEREMEVIPATDAMLRLVEELGPSPAPRRIEKVDLGFFSFDYDAVKWEIPPVWRIILDNGEQYYINAFTGNLEADL